MNIYGNRSREFSGEDMEIAQLLVAQAGLALEVTEKMQGLRTTLESRTVIGQTQGILMNQYNLGAERAFSLMKRLSQDRNVRLVMIAKQIVENRIQL